MVNGASYYFINLLLLVTISKILLRKNYLPILWYIPVV